MQSRSHHISDSGITAEKLEEYIERFETIIKSVMNGTYNCPEAIAHLENLRRVATPELVSTILELKGIKFLTFVDTNNPPNVKAYWEVLFHEEEGVQILEKRIDGELYIQGKKIYCAFSKNENILISGFDLFCEFQDEHHINSVVFQKLRDVPKLIPSNWKNTSEDVDFFFSLSTIFKIRGGSEKDIAMMRLSNIAHRWSASPIHLCYEYEKKNPVILVEQ